MKRFLFSLILLPLLAFSGHSQNLWVYSFNGIVEVWSSSTWKPVELYQKLSPADSIKFGGNSSISILDRKNDKVYAIQKPGINSVNDLIKEAGIRSKKQPNTVISYLWDSLTGKNNGAEYRSSAGVVYRDNDVSYAIASAATNATSTLPVDFTLIDRETGYSIGEMAFVGNSALIRVNNHSAIDLFVNIIDVDAHGNITPCIPVTSAQIMMQLLIPANSEVLLNSFPIVFAEPRGEDKLILVASPEWFDVDVVVSAMRSGQGTSKKVDVGVFKQRLIVK